MIPNIVMTRAELYKKSYLLDGSLFYIDKDDNMINEKEKGSRTVLMQKYPSKNMLAITISGENIKSEEYILPLKNKIA